MEQIKVPVHDQRTDEKNQPKSNVSKQKNSDRNSSQKDVASSESGEDEIGDEDGEVGDEDDEAGDECDAGGEARDRGSVDEYLINGIFAMDTINDSLLSDNDDADTSTTDHSFLEDASRPHKILETTARIDPKVAIEVAPQSSAPSSELPDAHWENAEYVFDDSVLRKGDGLETKCKHCGENDHVVNNCVAEQFTRSALKPLPPVPDWFKETLNAVCYCCKGQTITSRIYVLCFSEALIAAFCLCTTRMKNIVL